MSGTGYNELMAVDLGRLAIRGLLDRNPQLDPGAIDNVLMGTVIQECKTSNIAREAALSAGIPDKVPAFTVTLACISSNVAMSNASNLIKAGQADIVIASGTETMSDVPIRYSKKMRKVMLASQKSKSALKTFTMFWNAKSELKTGAAGNCRVLDERNDGALCRSARVHVQRYAGRAGSVCAPLAPQRCQGLAERT